MLTFLGKKKITDAGVANIFVNSVMDSVEKGFADVAGFINDSPEFIQNPEIQSDDYGRFLMIVVSGNIDFICEHFHDGHDKEIIRQVIDKFATVFGMSSEKFAELIKDYRTMMHRINHPSKTTVKAMAKAVFVKYELAGFQEEYFRSLNSPNPIFLKNLETILKNFIIDWTVFFEKYKLVSN
jgi:hypothetical protein